MKVNTIASADNRPVQDNEDQEFAEDFETLDMSDDDDWDNSTDCEFTDFLEKHTNEQADDNDPAKANLSILTLNHYGSTSLDSLVVEVEKESQLHELAIELGRSQLDDLAFSTLERVLLNERVVELRIDENQITAEGVEALCTILDKRQTPIQALSISQNPIGDEGAKKLATLLQNNYGFTHLNLNDCQITPEGIHVLANALKENTHLLELRLNQNSVKDAITSLAQMLVSNKKLRLLELNNVELDKNAALLLGLALKSNEHLQTLDIQSNDLDKEFTGNFYQEIFKNNTLCRYAGPDTEFEDILSICNRNSFITLSRTSLSVEEGTQHHQRAEYLIQQKWTTNKVPSLLYLAAKEALKAKRLPTDDGDHLFEKAYEEACLNIRK